MHSFFVFTFLLTWGFLTVNVQSAAVMSVDLGNEWMKVGVVSPGVPMEIVLNKESKRKTPAVVAFRDGVRVFGEDAQTIGVRFPAQSYGYLLDLLGKSVDHPIVKLYKERFPYYKIKADPVRGTVLFHHDDDAVYSVEEIVAQLLSKAKEMAQQSTGQIITECVLTVPGYFGQSERQALLQAANLADLKPLQLINDYTAIALNYGIFRRKEINDTAHYIMFYDMGAHKTTATIVEYKIVKTKERGYVESNPQLQVIGVGYDRTLGGLEMTQRLQKYLAKEFNEQKKTTNDITKNSRAMAKLFKEANRVKTVLSANNDHYAQVEGLIDEKDYKMQVTRATFETLCDDLFSRVSRPIEMALSNAGLSMDIMSQFILVGAGTRVPKVQEILHKFIKMELSKNINADEAATLGAAYRAADLSKGFKVKQFITKDAVLFPILVTFERAAEEDNTSKPTKRTLFGSMNPYPQKKVITFNKHREDFGFDVRYADFDYLGHERENMGSDMLINRIELKGVSDMLKNVDEHSESKGIKAHFEMDDSGILRLLNVDFVVEKTIDEEVAESTLSKLGSTISNLFSGKSDTAEDSDKKENSKNEEEAKEAEDKTIINKTSNTSTNETLIQNKTAEVAMKPKIVTIKEPMKLINNMKIRSLTEDQFKDSYKKIQDLNRIDTERTRRETALNFLESFVIEAQLRLDMDEYSECGTEDEIAKIRESCSAVSEWLYEDGAEAGAEMYESKLKDLQKLTADMYERHYEHKERPEALKALDSLLNGSSNFLATAKNLTKEANPEKDVYTPIEIQTLERIINETDEWKRQMMEEQDKVKKNEPVRLTIKSLIDKMATLDREVKYLVNKMKIWKPKKIEKPETDTNAEGAGGTEADVEEDPQENEVKDIPEDHEPTKGNVVNPNMSQEQESENEENLNEKLDTPPRDDRDDHSEL